MTRASIYEALREPVFKDGSGEISTRRRLACWCTVCGHYWLAKDDRQQLAEEHLLDVVDWHRCRWCIARGHKP